MESVKVKLKPEEADLLDNILHEARNLTREKVLVAGLFLWWREWASLTGQPMDLLDPTLPDSEVPYPIDPSSLPAAQAALPEPWPETSPPWAVDREEARRKVAMAFAAAKEQGGDVWRRRVESVESQILDALPF